ncbi:hypothetical protein LOZ12_004303 [Ophidiomyces ophidiicola]|nr:hypothetical protein LOZ62_004460 [Ophidiomyces ophidiicola]KAI1950173.1 hypothetical protein LOZ59_005873 [Ophidiomyces ophidiicola]KAI2004185.1 hypothetical protein LOZ50_004415 [Ophidiomyces ophidiicola]KAI2020846.1 hypothetical protein LOZ45_004969 [Ophidiomyces ophidiicola]KAI2033680.1 hypothetical protein LOZ48_001963 [Ophidiomyces ophidiicola]
MSRIAARPRVKRQTRLDLTPIPSSSPRFDHSSDSACTDHFAAVRCAPAGSSPFSRRPLAKRDVPPGSPAPLQKADKSSSSDDDEDAICTPGRRTQIVPRVLIHEPLAMKAKAENEDGDESVDEDDDEDDIRGLGSTRRRTGKRLLVELRDNNESQSSSSEAIISSPAKRRRRNRVASVQVRAQGESEQTLRDLEEDLEDLRDSAVTKERTRGSVVHSAATLKRKEQLEALRLRRAGEKPPTTRPTNESQNSLEHGGDSLSNEENEDQASDCATSTSDEDLPGDSDEEPPPPEDLDKYEDDFVLQDEDAEIGVPSEVVDLPFEFSRHRYKRLKDHFRDVVEWMVHNKLNPAFPRDDEVYKVAFSKVQDEVLGVAGSQLVSSVWVGGFKHALDARPGIEVLPFSDPSMDYCDACNRSKHPASYDIRFTGRPYSLKTLEPLFDEDDTSTSNDDGNDSDNSQPENKNNIDRDGRTIPDESTHFFLGSFCKSKATMAHTLIHWRFHLNEWVIDYLERKELFSDESVLEREHWSVKKRTKYANQVVDSMRQTGETDRLWKDFNLNAKTAREHGPGAGRW